MNKNTKSTLFRLSNCNVVWSNLSKPDDFRGSLKHDISVVISADEMAEMQKLTGAEKIAGVRTGEQGDIISRPRPLSSPRRATEVPQGVRLEAKQIGRSLDVATPSTSMCHSSNTHPDCSP